MASINIEIEVPSEEIRDNCLHALVSQGGWVEFIGIDEEENPIPNPITRLAHAKIMLAAWIRDHVTAYQITQAQEQARLAAIAGTEQVLDTATLTVGLS